MPPTVLVLDTFADAYRHRLAAEFPNLHILTARRAADVDPAAAEAQVLVAFGIAITDTLMARLPGLRWIQSLASGVDHFLCCPHVASDVIITSGHGIHGPAMRETVATLMLALSHDLPRLARAQSARSWERTTPWPLLAGKTAVIVGVGHASTAIAQLLKAFGMHVVGVSRTPRQVDGFDAIVPAAELAAAAARADWLVNVLPNEPANRDRIGPAVLAAMKPAARFINVGRGETVDEAALIDALRAGTIAGAGLDVYRSEPLPASSPLWELPNVIALPHIAGYFTEYEDYVMPILLDNMRLYLAGRTAEMRNLVRR